MMRSIKVLHIIDSLEKGGAEKLLIDYVAELKNVHPEITQFICTLQKLDNEFQVPDGIVRFNARFKKWNSFQVISKINKFVSENNINIIHAHLVDSILISRFLKAKCIEKKIGTYHNFYFDKNFVYYSWWRAVAEKLTYKKEYLSIYVSEEIRKCVEKVRSDNGEGIILNNFPNPSFNYQYKNDLSKILKIVIVANLRKTKNLQLAIDELSTLSDLPITIDIYGEGELREFLTSRINEKKAKVFLRGSQKITSELLSNYDLFLLTSESEGLPISLLECMTTGLPSVLPDHLPVFKNVAEDCSIFYSIRNSGDLAEKLKYILENKGILSGLSTKASKISQSYNVNNYVKNLHDLYKKG